MRYLKLKDKKKRRCFQKIEFKKLLGKALLYDLSLSNDLRGFLVEVLQKYHRYSKTQLRNRCVISNKARYLFTQYKISRLVFKNLVGLQRIVGIYKCVW